MATRIAIIDEERCKPDKCKKECISYCPPQNNDKEVIKIIDIEDIKDNNKYNDLKNKKKIAQIIESQCIGCNICVKKCPFNAIKIINLPYEDKSTIIHRYNYNGFRLYKLPQLKKNMVLGIIGENGIGKSTLINILSNQFLPNFEIFNNELKIKDILKKLHGFVIYDYLKLLYSGKLKISIKPQYLKSNNSLVKDFLKDYKNNDNLLQRLELNHILDTNMNNLSGGELQRLYCYITLLSNADVYIFDEPTNYLDIKQRLEVTKIIREYIHPDKYIIVIDHDMSIIDYIADEIVILYGKPGAYGIVSQPMTTLEGINIYLNGYIPSENVRFREDEFNLKPSIELVNQEDFQSANLNNISYASNIINYPSSNFKLIINENSININSSLYVILGENGNGKSSYLNYLSNSLSLPVSFKPQTLNITKYCKNNIYPTVDNLLLSKIHISYTDPRFIKEVVKPLDIYEIKDRTLDMLSGGELQRVLLVLCLGTPALIYFIDEPSANLDIEKRMTVIKVIKRFILGNHKSAFIIEHDIMMAVAFSQEFSSRIITINKEIKDNNKICTISPFMSFKNGISTFLKSLDITMRVSNHNRPRINNINSQLDKEQKNKEVYYT
jgi:ATP-binding cassette subfamily E protein 1